MRETTALVKEYDGTEDLVIEGTESAVEAFQLPTRNWTAIIDSYNDSHKKKFPFTPLQCKVLIEYVKKGIPAQHILINYGYSERGYATLIRQYNDLEDRMGELQAKSELSDKDYEEYQGIMRSPYRLLISDINRAKAVDDIRDWERFNEMAIADSTTMQVKMRGKFREFFDGKDSGASSNQVTINISGDFLDKL